MARYTVIPMDTFDTLQMNAGVLLKHFDIEAAAASVGNPGFTDDDLVSATTGGINPTCVPTYSDFFEDVDNAPVNVKEGKHLDSWACAIATTCFGTSVEAIRLALGAADVDSNGRAVIPRRDLKQSDFNDSIWWVGDKANGGFVAIELKNVLSTGGFSLQTTKNGKGQIALTLTGHVGLDTQDEIPMMFYSIDPDEEVTYSITQTLSHVKSSLKKTSIEAGNSIIAFLTADSGYTIGTPTVTMGGTDVTLDTWNSVQGAVVIAEVTGDVVITASATED